MSALHETLVDLFTDVNKLLHHHVRHVFKNNPIHHTAMMLMHHISHNPGLAVSELSRRTGIAKSHVSNMLDDLSRRNLVEKRPDSTDHRLVRIYLAGEASELMRQMRDEVRRRLAEAISVVPEDQVVRLIGELQDLKEALTSSPHE